MTQTSAKRRLVCACCGGEAGRHVQFFNQDTGFGVCAKCVKWIKGRGMSDAEFERIYGQPGVHYDTALAEVE